MIGVNAVVIFSMITLTEMIALKLFYITHFINMVAMDENFLSRIIICQNTLFTCLLMSVRVISGEPFQGWVCGRGLSGIYKAINIW